MTPSLKSKDFNKANELNSLKTDLLTRLNNGKRNLQHRWFLALEKEINKAVRPV